MIPQSFIDDLLQRVDVHDVVGRYVKLKKAGANYLGLCPFHNEKSPSFTVSPTKQFYHCFGCGVHGTAISFLIEYSGLSFPEAVRELAQSVGMTVPDTREARQGSSSGAPSDASTEGGGPSSGEMRSNSSAIIEALESATAWYRNALRHSERAIAYLKKRGLTGEIAARFGMGYAPDGWNNLREAFEDYRHPVLVDAGLVIAKDGTSGSNEHDATDTTRLYDRFRDRVMFPIRNPRGRVIGFGGRIIDEGEPKYLNSPETAVFVKGSELYGLFEARQAIREQGFALVVEGYMDVVALAQLGVANAVATLGTACTSEHVRKLLRQTDRITFSFDGDAAGKRAAWRALEASLAFAADDKAFSFLFLPVEHDPDSYIREHGRERFIEFVRRALPLSEYLLSELARDNNLGNAEGRAKALFDARPLVKALPAGALRMQIIRSLAAATGATVEEILDSFQLVDAPRSRRAHMRRIERKAPQGLVQRALSALIMYPAHTHALSSSDIETLEQAAGESRDLIVETIAAAKAGGPAVDFIAMSDALRESPNMEVYEGLMQDILRVDEYKRDLLLDDADDPAQAARRQEQQTLRARELRYVILKMQDRGIVAELARISSSGLAGADAAANYQRLFEEQKRIRQKLDE
ncbi:MAG: DNA primase [Burkholderiaceae bacterium]